MASNDQLELAHWTCKEATRSGARQARASVSRRRYTNLEYRERRIDTLEESTTKGLDLTLYIDGKYSSHRTSDLREEALAAFIRESVAMTRHLTADAYRHLPEPEYYADRPSTDLDLSDPGYAGSVPDDRHRLARTIEEAALEHGGEQIISVTAGYSESKSESAMVTTNGFEGFEERTDFWCGASVTARDEGDRRPQEWWWEGQRYRGQLSDPAAIGRRAAARALERVGSDKIPTETMHVIVENRTVGRLMRFYRRALSGASLQQRRSFLEGKLGATVASPHLTIVDDPLIVRGQASRLYDDEGISAQPLPIIERGVLKNYYVDTYYGRKLGMAATTGSASNITFGSDELMSVDAWMRELGRGILITGFLGGNSNSSTGDFSTGVQGFVFEDGVRNRPIAEMNIAGNHLDFWNKLIGMGDDPYPFSSIRSPALVFDPIIVAGA